MVLVAVLVLVEGKEAEGLESVERTRVSGTNTRASIGNRQEKKKKVYNNKFDTFKVPRTVLCSIVHA